MRHEKWQDMKISASEDYWAERDTIVPEEWRARAFVDTVIKATDAIPGDGRRGEFVGRAAYALSRVSGLPLSMEALSQSRLGTDEAKFALLDLARTAFGAMKGEGWKELDGITASRLSVLGREGQYADFYDRYEDRKRDACDREVLTDSEIREAYAALDREGDEFAAEQALEKIFGMPDGAILGWNECLASAANAFNMLARLSGERLGLGEEKVPNKLLRERLWKDFSGNSFLKDVAGRDALMTLDPGVADRELRALSVLCAGHLSSGGPCLPEVGFDGVLTDGPQPEVFDLSGRGAGDAAWDLLNAAPGDLRSPSAEFLAGNIYERGLPRADLGPDPALALECYRKAANTPSGEVKKARLLGEYGSPKCGQGCPELWFSALAKARLAAALEYDQLNAREILARDDPAGRSPDAMAQDLMSEVLGMTNDLAAYNWRDSHKGLRETDDEEDVPVPMLGDDEAVAPDTGVNRENGLGM